MEDWFGWNTHQADLVACDELYEVSIEDPRSMLGCIFLRYVLFN
jgi:hypothetical protein